MLIGFTSYWSVFDAKALKEKDANKRPLLEQQQIQRGRILAADGTVIARSVPKGHGAGLRYVRRYPEGALYGHPIGYSFVRQGDSEFEQFHNDELVGNESEFSSILDQLRGRNQEGNDIVTNLDPAAQRVALADLEAAGFGAVVAIEPQSGRVQGAGLEPALRPQPRALRTLEAEHERNRNAAARPRHPGPVPARLDLQGGDRGGRPRQRHDHAGNARSTRRAHSKSKGQPLQNDFGENFGPITLDTALTNSVNTWFAQLGEQVGEDTLFEYMDRFGFNSTPAIDLPADQVYTSGVFDEEGELLGPNDPIDLARVAIGQERLAVTPLQMAEVAAAVANRGKLMKPQIWSRVVDPDGRVTKRLDPSQYSQPISAADRRRADHRDGRRRQRRHRHQRGDPRRPGRRQDRHGGNARQRSLRRRRRKRTRPGSSASPRPTTRRSRSRRRSSARPNSATTWPRRSSATSPKPSSTVNGS